MIQSNHHFRLLAFVQKLCDDTGNSDLYQPGKYQFKNIYLAIKQVLIDQYLTNWYSKLQASNKGKHFNLFKHEHKREAYLSI